MTQRMSRQPYQRAMPRRSKRTARQPEYRAIGDIGEPLLPGTDPVSAATMLLLRGFARQSADECDRFSRKG